MDTDSATVTDRHPSNAHMRVTCPSCESFDDHAVLLTGRDHLIHAAGSFAVVRCSDCRLAFTWPQIHGEDFSLVYPESSYPAYRTQSRSSHGIVKQALESWTARRRSRSVRRGPYARFFHRPPGCLLDVGCGVGHHGVAFRDRSWIVHGIEPSAAAAREAERRGIIVHHGLLADAGVGDQTFDLIIFNHSLEHIPCPRDGLQRAYAWLNPGGDIAVAVPDFGCWQSRLFKETWFHLDLPRHLQHFTASTLTELAVQVGFKNVSVTRYSSLNGLPNSVQYRLRGHLILPDRGVAGRLTALAYRVLGLMTWPCRADHLLLTARRESD